MKRAVGLSHSHSFKVKNPEKLCVCKGLTRYENFFKKTPRNGLTRVVGEE
jgi:hypothetical protein